jgi:carbohydrate-selective porin OprB
MNTNFRSVCCVYTHVQQMAELTDKPIVVAETSTVPGPDVDKGIYPYYLQNIHVYILVQVWYSKYLNGIRA